MITIIKDNTPERLEVNGSMIFYRRPTFVESKKVSEILAQNEASCDKDDNARNIKALLKTWIVGWENVILKNHDGTTEEIPYAPELIDCMDMMDAYDLARKMGIIREDAIKEEVAKKKPKSKRSRS